VLGVAELGVSGSIVFYMVTVVCPLEQAIYLPIKSPKQCVKSHLYIAPQPTGRRASLFCRLIIETGIGTSSPFDSNFEFNIDRIQMYLWEPVNSAEQRTGGMYLVKIVRFMQWERKEPNPACILCGK
jgi:hypothetical protein